MHDVQAMAWFGNDETGTQLLAAIARWCTVLPHMMLLHVCEGHDLESILQVHACWLMHAYPKQSRWLFEPALLTSCAVCMLPCCQSDLYVGVQAGGVLCHIRGFVKSN